MLRLWLWCALGAVGCLEQVTGEPTALDPRFVAVATADDTGGPGHASVEHVEMAHQSDDTGGPSHEDIEHVEVTPPQPFEDVEGEKVLVTGTIVALLSGPVELDVSRVDADFPGGRESVGKLLFEEAGDFELQAPKGIGSLYLVAFQDPDLDGPGEGDFYAEMVVDVADEPVMDLVLSLSQETRSNAGGGPAHIEVGPPQPFEDVEGEKVLVSGTVVAELSGAVELDVSRVDADFPGGRESVGKLLFDEASDFELQVPKGIGSLSLVAFQDPGEDGPGESDPYAEMIVDVADEPVTGLIFTLSTEARSQAGGGPVHTEAPPGFGSDDGPPPDGKESAKDPFAGMEGERVPVQGIVVFDGDAVVDLDLFQPEASAPGGRTLLGKLKISSGPFTLQVPLSLGALELDAFADKTGDGPSADDPRGQVSGIDLTEGAVSGVQLVLEALTEEAPSAPPKGGGTDLEEEFARIGSGGDEATTDMDGL